MAPKTGGRAVLRVLVTGATGFLGRAVVGSLLADGGCTVRALALPNEPIPGEWPPGAVEIVRGDVTSPGSLDRAVDEQHAAIHAAGVVSHARGDADLLCRINAIGTRNILDSCSKSGIRRLVHISSVGALGMRTDGLLTDEETPYNWPAAFCYMESKLRGQNDVLGRAAELGIDAVVLNPASMMGPGDPGPNSALNRLHRMVMQSPLLPSFSGTLGVVDVRDVALAAVRALRTGQTGRCYLLVAANVSYADVLRTIAHHMHLRRRVVPLPGWLVLAAARATEALASVSGGAPALPGAYGELSTWRCAYRNSRSCADFGDIYRAFDQTIADGCEFYLANYAT